MQVVSHKADIVNFFGDSLFAGENTHWLEKLIFF